MKNHKKAFTLVEIIIVIAVIAVLAAVLILVLPGAIEKANTSSALSDAKNIKNAYTEYVTDKGSYTDDCIVLIRKGAKIYLYGYIDDRIQSSLQNPFDKDNTEHFLSELEDKNIIVATGNRPPENITSSVPDVLSGAEIYAGYKLNDFASELYFTDKLINITPGEKANVSAVVMPESEISYESDHTDIATIDKNGNVCGVSAGMATITANCGGKTATMIVNVVDYIEFSGDAVQLKQMFEETGDSTLFIRLMNNIYSNDVSILPINLPENKVVKLDMNGYYIWFHQFIEDTTASPDCMILNNGGSLTIESTRENKNPEGLQAYFTNPQISSPGEEHYTSTICNKKGTLTISTTIYYFASSSYYDYEVYCCIENHDRLLIENYDTYIDFVDDAMKDGYDPPFSYVLVHNAPGGHAVLRNVNVNHSIINEGVIESLENCHLGGNEFAIKNSGTILNISDCEIVTYFSITNETDENAILSSGRISNMENTTLRTGEDSSELLPDSLPQTALCLTGGSVGTIKNCTFIAKDAAISMTDCVLDNLLTDGTYSHRIDEKLIANGYVCKEKGEKYVILPE